MNIHGDSRFAGIQIHTHRQLCILFPNIAYACTPAPTPLVASGGRLRLLFSNPVTSNRMADVIAPCKNLLLGIGCRQTLPLPVSFQHQVILSRCRMASEAVQSIILMNQLGPRKFKNLPARQTLKTVKILKKDSS